MIFSNNKNKACKFKTWTQNSYLIKKLFFMAFIMFVCTIISMISHRVDMFESNIVMIYLLGILIISYRAEGYFYSLSASVCAVLLYNFFFTEPYYTLKVNNPNYLITFFVMFIVGFITSMLTIRVRLKSQQVKEREVYISSLYYIEKKLLNVKSIEDLAITSSKEIAKQMEANVIIQLYNSNGLLLYECMEGNEVFNDKIDRLACMEAYQSGSPCGRGTILYSDAKAYYNPIFGQNGVLGVIGIALNKEELLTEAQRSFIDVIMPQIAVVLQREKNYEKQQIAKMEMEKERLRSDMLRSISHDFRTPLAGVMGLASTALDNYDKMNDEVKKNFLQSIYEDADWLNEIVENILQTTRFEEGKIKLNIEEEAAEEIITEAIRHVKKHASKHNIQVNIPEEIILIQADGVLLRQVLVNLLNNAISYSPEESDITVTLYREENRAFFEIKDNGPGIAPAEMPYIFERYQRSNSNGARNRKGMGLGLALCKSIITAHNGEIMIQNNKPHGTIVSFYILSEKEKTNGTTDLNC